MGKSCVTVKVQSLDRIVVYWFNKNEKYLRSQGQNKTIITRSVILSKQWTPDDGQYVRDRNAVSIITSITTKMKIIVLNNESILIITHFKGENSSTIWSFFCTRNFLWSNFLVFYTWFTIRLQSFCRHQVFVVFWNVVKPYFKGASVSSLTNITFGSCVF